MKTLEQVVSEYKPPTIDGRDISRLVDFLSIENCAAMGLELKDEYKLTHEAIPFTRENVLKQLEKDVDFGFEKALDCRGISASCMFGVVLMWNWILEEGLEDFDRDDYAMYGLPLLKATAIKYGFTDQIDGFSGTEPQFDGN